MWMLGRCGVIVTTSFLVEFLVGVHCGVRVVGGSTARTVGTMRTGSGGNVSGGSEGSRQLAAALRVVTMLSGWRGSAFNADNSAKYQCLLINITDFSAIERQRDHLPV